MLCFGGVVQGFVFVILDVIKEFCIFVVYWVMGNVVCCGDNLKILGIIMYVFNLSLL